MQTFLDRLIFGRQTKGIPTHRVQDSTAFHPMVAGHDVGWHVIAAMTDTQTIA